MRRKGGGSSVAWRSTWFLRLMVSGVALAGFAVVGGCSRSNEQLSFPPSGLTNPEWAVLTDSIATINGELSPDPVFLDDLATQADSALLGYVLAQGAQSGRGADLEWTISFEGLPEAADRAALGLLDLSIAFERSGADGGVVSGSGSILDLLTDLTETAEFVPNPAVVVAAAAEIGGTREGRLAAPGRVDLGRDPAETRTAVVWLESLADELGLGLEQRSDLDQAAGPVELWLVSVEDLRMVASLPTLCAEQVPLIGGRGCLRPEARPVSLVDENKASTDWLRGTTGPLGPDPEPLPPSADGGLGWTNNEAQSYRPERVQINDGFSLLAVPRREPDINVLPYESGLVVSRESFGFGTYEFDLVLPVGEGLWPAVWLLDDQACEAPGRCAGYGTGIYHEIDVVETRGQDPDELFLSVHWWNGTARSESSRLRASDIAGKTHTFTLERLPGLLVWRLDGEEIARVGGPARSADGPHRDAPMRIVMNLAVGGSFAGDRLVGRNGLWWGDAMVPEGFPDVGWSQAELVVSGVRFTPLG